MASPGWSIPVTAGTETIFKLTPSGQLKPWATALTTVLGLSFDNRDRLYALESMTVAGFQDPRKSVRARLCASIAFVAGG